MPVLAPAIGSTATGGLGFLHPDAGRGSPLNPGTWKRARYPLGAHLDPDGESVAFAVHAPEATSVLLEVYADPLGQDATFDYWLACGKDGIWRACIAWDTHGMPSLYYAYRCFGPNWPFSPLFARGGSAAGFVCDVDAAGHRFNPNKALIDPYARELSHDKESPGVLTLGHHGGAYGTGPAEYRGLNDAMPPRPRREVDTGRIAPKSVLVFDESSFGIKPRIKPQDAVIYEAHLRGLTRHPAASRLRATLGRLPGFEAVTDVPPEWRGTYLGAGCMAPYLKALGVNAIEFLPVHECANDLNGEGDAPGQAAPSANYWGYMTSAFFAPDKRHAVDKTPGGPTREFKRMVKAFHDQGIEVYLDVVYNHHGEGGLWGKADGSGPDPDTCEVLSLRGFDNAGYYALSGDKRYFWDSSGCGNNLDASQPVVRRLIGDSLHYWSQEMGVDGFRFDLASVLGRGRDSGQAFSSTTPLLGEIAALAKKYRIEIIAEAWDTGGSFVGGFPTGWAEWNGHYRDSLRRFAKGDGNAFDFMAAMNGDYERYADQGGAHKSVNFVTAHDGFTLMDLVSYPAKANGQPWPFGPSDGGSDGNDSWDSGGDAGLRRQRLRNFLVLLVFARGVPMLMAGDEFGRTQNGNNNAYNLDNLALWLHWDMAGSPTPNRVSWATQPGAGPAYHDNYGDNGGTTNKLIGLVRYLLGLRAAHPCLRQIRYGDLQLDAGSDVTYAFARPDGQASFQGTERSLMLRIDGSEVRDRDFLLLVNMQAEPVEFLLPPTQASRLWRRLVDTAAWAENEGNAWKLQNATAITGDTSLSGASPAPRYVAQPWSVVALAEA